MSAPPPETPAETGGLDLAHVVRRIHETRALVPARRSVLVAVSGIDGCGKGFVTARIVAALQSRTLRAAAVNLDGWLNLPHRRFDPSNPAEHFYLHAIRFEAMFAGLILPLRDHRSHRVEADYAEETAAAYRRHVYEFEDLDVIVLEGIFLLKPAFRAYYDLSVWIECSFETALERAIARSQEGLSRRETLRAYRTIYFPAQRLHFERDDPKRAAMMVVDNDPGRGPLRAPPARG